MIRFLCPHCNRSVRVKDDFGGRKGRCPFCKQVVQIPARSEPAGEAHDEIADLAAALSAAAGAAEDTATEAVPPPPPHAVEDASLEQEAELEIAASDPRGRTDKLEPLVEEVPAPPPAPRPPARAESPSAAPAGRKRTLVLVLGIAGAAVVLLGGTAAALYFGGVLKLGAPAPQQAASQRAGPIATPTRPAPGPAFRPRPLSGEIAAATARSPVGVFCMIHADLRGVAEAVRKTSPGARGLAGEIARSRFWTDAPERIAEGTMPETATLFLVAAQPSPARELFDPFFGAVPAGPPDPTAGLWAMTAPERHVPHFLVRVSGEAAEHYTAKLVGLAQRLTGKSYPPGPYREEGKLRLIGPGPAGREMLLGTAETIIKESDGSGLVRVDDRQLQRLREWLTKVTTEGRPVVGCVMLSAAGAVDRALGVPAQPPSWVAGNSRLVFSLDPAPGGEGEIVIAPVPPKALRAVSDSVRPLLVTAEGDDVLRVSGGTGPEVLEVVGRLLPGLQQLLARAMALAEPVPSLASLTEPPPPEPPLETQPAPAPETQPAPAPETQPAPAPETQPAPEPQPVPGPERMITFVCTNSKCPTRGKPYEVSSRQVTQDVLDLKVPLVCPHCKEPRAVVAVKCPHCGHFYVRTLDECPKCAKPRK